MLLKLLTARAGYDAGGSVVSQVAGDQIDLPDGEAQRLVDAGQAEVVGAASSSPPPRPERPPVPREATAPPKRDATKRR